MSYFTLNLKAVASAPAVALRRKVYVRGDGAVVAIDGVSVGLAALPTRRALRTRPIDAAAVHDQAAS
jgi:hypothetical protein